jgi:type IV secretory pathway TraG/TraD family ATPase VirD4
VRWQPDIPKSEDPVWSDAAREILVACVSALQATKPEGWIWHDLHEVATSDADTLLSLAKAHHLDAVRLPQNSESRTTQSVLSTFQAHMHVVAALGDAWRHNANGSFSVARWLARPTPYRPVILQHDPRYPELSHAWIGGLLAMLASAVGSPSLNESRERRIWIFADEFPQLPRLSHFSTFLDLGRSKGFITVIGAQDLAQLRATYGHERADAWVGMIGTKIITRLNAGRGAEEASQLVGDQEIERVERSETVVGAQASTTTMVRREMRRVVTAAEIATRLGPRDDGIRVLVLGQGADALELTVPYLTLPERRPGHDLGGEGVNTRTGTT